MSSDNFIAVFSSKDVLNRDLRWYVEEGMMASIEGDKEDSWKKNVIANTPYDESYPTRESALVAAHNMIKDIGICEYGVIEI